MQVIPRRLAHGFDHVLLIFHDIHGHVLARDNLGVLGQWPDAPNVSSLCDVHAILSVATSWFSIAVFVTFD
jgi:hypothetical protein